MRLSIMHTGCISCCMKIVIILQDPKGRKSSKTKLTGQEKQIKELLDKKVSYSAIGRILGVHRLTVSSFVREKM